MIRKNAVIYCFADSNIYPGVKRTYLDACFFRLLAYANAHGMQVVAYYEDIQEQLENDLRSGLMRLQSDLAKKSIDTILVIDSKQLPKSISYKYSQKVVSIKTTERV